LTMDLRDLFPLDLVCHPELLSVYLYPLLQARARASVRKPGDSIIELKPYEVIVRSDQAERDLNLSQEQLRVHLQTLEKMRRIRVRQIPGHLLILYHEITFPINANGDNDELEQKARSISYKQWVEEEKMVIEKRFSPKYLELVATAYQHLNAVVEQKELCEISAEHYEELIELLQNKGLKNSSINDYTQAIKAGLNRAVKRGYLSRSPWEGLERLSEQRKQPIIFQRNEIEHLLQNSPDWMIPMIKFALLTAMRRNEILSMLWENLDVDEEFFWVRHTRSFRPKMGKERLLAVTDEIRHLLKGVKEVHRTKGIESDSVFVDDRGKIVTPSRFTHEVKKALRFAELREELHLHALRRTAATHLYFKTKDVYIVKEVLGHSDIRVTMRYLGVPEQKIKEAMNLMTFDDFLPKIEL
jgi:integrase